jgi:hypothetical protein
VSHGYSLADIGPYADLPAEAQLGRAAPTLLGE